MKDMDAHGNNRPTDGRKRALPVYVKLLNRHVVFVVLVATHALLVNWLDIMLWALIRGAILFVFSAWCASYWEGPYTSAVFNPRPFRSTAILLGVMGMIAALGFEIVAGYHW